MALPRPPRAIALIVGSPTFTAPVLHQYRSPPIDFFDGQVAITTDWQSGDPEVWPLNTLKRDPEDGEPIKEALFANHNADMAISVDGQSLVGRTALARGPAHKIKVQAPLTFAGRTLGLDPAFKPGGGDVPPTVAFRAVKNITQSIPNNVPTKVVFAAEDYDIGGFYNPGTSRWTPPLGLIHLDARLWITGLTAGAAIGVHIYKNGAQLKLQWHAAAGAADGSVVNFDDIANGTDYYELFCTVQTGTGAIFGDPFHTYFSGHVPSGQQGVQGIQGPVGLTGPQGPQGIQGVQGVIGPIGLTGPQGIQGVKGDTGNTGPQGPTGDQGNPGALWYQGAPAPGGAIGGNGDFYLRISTGDVYQKAGGTWTLIGNIKGPQGIQGIQGPTGADSTVPGPQGATGLTGPQGATGSQGIQGVQGVKGDIGSLWYSGAGAPAVGLGVNGDYYLNHTTGDVSLKTAGAWNVVTNIKGPQGLQGIQGITGAAGPATMWYSGSANPVVGIGVNGDYYFNTTNATVWQKSGGAWSQISTIAGGGQPIGFRASNPNAQTFPGSGARTKMIFPTEEYDQGSFYDPALSRWTPPAGIIHITVNTYIPSGLASGMGLWFWIFKNGLAHKEVLCFPWAANQSAWMDYEDLAGGTDYYEVFIQSDNSANFSTSANAVWNWVCGHVVSAQGPTGPQGIQGVVGPQGVQGPVGPQGAPSTVPGPPATYPTGAHGFSAQKTVDQSVASNTWTKVDFGVETYDTGSQYDPAMSRYVPVAGDAFFVASVYCSGLLAGANIYLGIYKNGALFRAATSNNTNGSAFVSCADSANGTDYYEAWVYATSASGGNFTIPASEINLLFFQGFQPVGPTGPQGPAGFGIVQIGTTPPASPSVGNFWYDTTTGILSCWIDDGNSSQWIQVAPTINLDTSNYVGILSPAFTGTPTAPTAAPGTNTTQVATTAFVASEAVRYDAAQGLVAAQHVQARTNIYAAPFDALAYNGMQVNGGMELSQELGSTARTTNGYLVDNWLGSWSGSMALSVQQVTDAPPGYNNSLKATVTTAAASLAAGDSAYFVTFIEGYRSSRLCFGTANAQPVSIGFWTKIHRPGVYSASLRTYATPYRAYPFTFTQNVADTWEFKTVTIPGDVTGTWAGNTNAGSFALFFCIASGATLLLTPNVWSSANGIGAIGTTNGVAATSDTFQLAGLVVLPGLELPSAARASYIVRPYDQELLLCKRYYEKTSSSWRGYSASGYVGWVVPFAVEKRVVPTLTLLAYGSTRSANMSFQAWYGQLTTSAGIQMNLGAGADGYEYGIIVSADARL
jgi:hypothetical protein